MPSRTTAVLAVILGLGCAGHRTQAVSPPPAVVRAYPATRWIPAHPTYVVAARTVRDAQRSLRGVWDVIELVESVGQLAGIASPTLRDLIAVDPLSPDAALALGIDLEGGIAVFSETIDPTFVVHLAAPDRLRAFVDTRRRAGSSRAVVVDGTQVVTAAAPGGIEVSWAIDADWLWVHVALPAPFGRASQTDGTRWLTSSRRPGAPAWTAAWQWARPGGGGAPAVTGFLDLRALLAALAPRAAAAIACAELVAPVLAGAASSGRVALALDNNGARASGRVSIELGAAAASLARAIRPPPEGWSVVAARSAIAAQWNVDLELARAWIAPCVAAAGGDLAWLDSYGVRAARVLVERYDPGRRTNSRGAISVDLVHQRFIAEQLDAIPLRTTIERDRRFGPYAGHSISIPFGGPTIEYVLTDALALAGLGGGMLAAVVGRGPGTPGALAAIDLAPPSMPRAAWAALLALIGAPAGAVDLLLGWRDGHLTLALDGTRLVLEVAATRQ